MPHRTPDGVDKDKATHILFQIWDNKQLRLPRDRAYFNGILDPYEPSGTKKYKRESHGRRKNPPVTKLRSKTSLKTPGEQRRRAARIKLEGKSKLRQQQLDYIYTRDKGICYSCGLPVLRKEATREHLFRPIRDYPHLARDTIYMAVAHRECNK